MDFQRQLRHKQKMDIRGITWRGENFDDIELLQELPANLAQVLSGINGFILYEGALHIRGACTKPEWHSLRQAWRGANAFYKLYPNVQPSDIPFAQDQVGDQFLIRSGAVCRLLAETGHIEHVAESFEEFFRRVNEDIEEFLNVGLNHPMEPGNLLLAYPPFVFKEAAEGVSLKPIKVGEVILFHANLARQLRDLPEGGKLVINSRTDC